MNFDGQRYYRVNRFFLEMTGLWPYNKSIYIHIYRAFTSFILISSFITQIIRIVAFLSLFFEMKNHCLLKFFLQFAKLQSTIHDLDRFLYNLTYGVPCIIYILKFFSYIINIDRVKELMARIQYDWNTLNEKECEIIRYHAITGMRYTILFFATCLPFLFCFIFCFFLPGLLDLVNPLNESRTRTLPILAEYYILDEQKYFYPLLVHQSLLIILGIIIVLATESLNMAYMHHGCGLFDVASYRMKHIFDDGVFSAAKNETYNTVHARIVKIVNIQKRSFEFLDYLMSTFRITYLVMLMLGVVAITINTFRLIEAVSIMNDFKELIGSVSFIGGQYGILFFINYFGQKVTDCSFVMFNRTYDVPWYTAPVHIQKLFAFILQRTVKGYVLSIGGVIIASLEDFASVTSLTLSYLTMIYSVR